MTRQQAKKHWDWESWKLWHAAKYSVLTTTENTITLFFCQPKILLKHCLQFLLGVKMAPRETENKAYVKFLGDKERALWYVIVSSIVIDIFLLGPAFPFVSWAKQNSLAWWSQDTRKCYSWLLLFNVLIPIIFITILLRLHLFRYQWMWSGNASPSLLTALWKYPWEF